MTVRKWLMLMAVLGLVGFPAVSFAQDEEGGAGETVAGEETPKLVKVTTLKQAFGRALQRRQQLARRVVALVRTLREEEDDAKKEELREELERSNRALQGMKVAMEVIFGLGNRREYEFVADTIYLKVGTVEQTFARAVRNRDALRKFVVEKTKAKEEAEDAETVQQLEKEIQDATKRYQVVVASLQLVFGVVPQRNYTYNPENATLYLNVTDEEVEKLRARIEEIRKEQEGDEGNEGTGEDAGAGE